jgi:hypothetical protein
MFISQVGYFVLASIGAEALAYTRWQAETVSLTYYDSGAEVEAALASRGFRAGEFVIHEGWFDETLNKPLGFDQIALLRLDCDWYRPTALCIETLTPL